MPPKTQVNLKPAISFNYTYKGRVGHAPGGDGWTYHHILPVRYYWSAAFILVKLYRLKEYIGKPPSKDIKDRLKAEFGIEDVSAYLGDDFDLSGLKNSEIVRYCVSLHQHPQNGRQPFEVALKKWLASQSAADIVAAVDPLTGPRYGGFAGMSGSEQRTDDPKSGVELRKPISFDQEKWNRLKLIGDTLDRCVENKAPATSDVYNCRVTASDARLLTSSLRELSEDIDDQRVHPFAAADWAIGDGKKPWHYAKAIPANAGRLADCSHIFHVRQANELGGTNWSVGMPLPAPNSTVVTQSQGNPQKLQFVNLV